MADALKAIWSARVAVEGGDLPQLQEILRLNPELLGFSINGQPGFRGLMHIAAGCGNMEVCEFLRAQGQPVDEEAPGEAYVTPLTEAASNGHAAAVSWLLNQSARVDGSPKSPVNPLLNAVRFGHLDVVNLLLNADADVNRMHDNLNQTAADLAKVWGHSEILQRLTDHGGVPVTGAHGDWPRLFAAGVGAYVADTAGEVLSPVYGWNIDGDEVTLRLCNVDGKWRYKLAFTMGLSKVKSRVELFIGVTANWPISRSAELADDPVSFPMRLLHLLSQHVINGGAMHEGFCLRKGDALAGGIVWPPGCAAVVAVDHVWSGEKHSDALEGVGEDSSDVQLLLLVPVDDAKLNSLSTESQLLSFAKKKRSSRWNAVALPFD